jgi:hypothetical protein
MADEDLDAEIIQGVRSRELAVDILDVKTAGLRETKDTALLGLAAQQGRISGHARSAHDDPAFFETAWPPASRIIRLFVVPQRSAIGEIVESLLLVWAASQAEEWHDNIVYLPLR